MGYLVSALPSFIFKGGLIPNMSSRLYAQFLIKRTIPIQRLPLRYSVILSTTPLSTSQRNFRSSSKKSDVTKVSGNVANLIKTGTDRIAGSSTEQLFLYTHVSLAVLTPVAFVLSPSILNAPVDLALGVLIPVHSHLGLSTVLTDYIPPQYQQLSLQLLWLVSILTGLGLLKINLCGSGITESIKSLWRQTSKKEQRKLEQAKVSEKH